MTITPNQEGGGANGPATTPPARRGRHRTPARARLVDLGLISLAALLALVGFLLVTGGGSAPSPAGAAPAQAPAPAATFSYAALPPTTRELPAARSATRRPSNPMLAASVPPAAPDQPATIAPTAATTAADEVQIPALDIAGPIVPATVQDGSLHIPPPTQVGRWVGGADLDAAVGTTLLAGHVNLNGTPGVLASLYRARYGDQIYLTGPQGLVSHWEISAVQVVHKDALPTSIFAATGARRLVLVTCTGRLLTIPGYGHSYADNLIVTALPVGP